MGLCESQWDETDRVALSRILGKVFLTEQEKYQEKQQMSLSLQETSHIYWNIQTCGS